MEIEIVALILAGGKGTRLEALTRKSAKPAIEFGGKYKIIDFALSNCANSEINHIGVLTQYESSDLNSYIGDGSNWGFNGVNSLTSILSPKQTEEGSAFYKGTADAVYRNLDWLDKLNPANVLILSGDHIYIETYLTMLKSHKDKNADCTISVINVSKEEASRFGILKVDSEQRILEFKEKPKNPTSTLASMGIYIFKYKTLRNELILDAKNPESSHDFGKDIIPAMLAKKKKLYSYEYKGYWKDVGTISSLHQANMDLLLGGDSSIYSIIGKNHIFTEDNHLMPQLLGEKSSVTNCLINQGALIFGSVDSCVISSGVIVEEGAKATKCVIMSGAKLCKGCRVNNAVIAPGITIGERVTINKVGKEVVLVSSSVKEEGK
ncbi:MAG: glucose-1-phosphate adenylyltransferase [Bacilli bacterium]|nr:glucose-1-phosphate adenylyltransferase [Bacilli bacterium]MDY6430884.1 glucose-1-phosphate adenylyltransferase [Bacilli bacterium]